MQAIGTIAAMAALVAATGSATAAEQAYELPPFTSISISSGINAVVTVDGAQSVRAESPNQTELDELVVEVDDGVLRVHTGWNLLDLLNFEDRETTVTIVAPALNGAEASAGADVDVTGIAGSEVSLKASSGADLHTRAAAGERFLVDVSSGADLDVEGACDTLVARVSSGSDLDARRLECAAATIEASSGASAEIFASTSLDASASSGGDIEVYGNPSSVDQEASIGGGIELMN